MATSVQLEILKAVFWKANFPSSLVTQSYLLCQELDGHNNGARSTKVVLFAIHSVDKSPAAHRLAPLKLWETGLRTEIQEIAVAVF